MGYFQVWYASMVVIYERKMFIRLATDVLYPKNDADPVAGSYFEQ